MSTIHSLPDRGQVRGQTAGEVRAQLARQRMNVATIAKITGRSHTYWWRRITSEETPLDVDDLADLASILGVEITTFFSGMHENGPRPGVSQNEGREDVRHQGLEPRTRWLRPGHLADLVDLGEYRREREQVAS